MRLSISLLLVVLMLSCLVSPALADSATGDGTVNAYTYNWTVTCLETTGTAYISISPRATNVEACAENHLYDSKNDMRGTSYMHDEAFGSVYVSADNYIVKSLDGQDYYFVATIQYTTGKFWVNGTNVVPGVNDYPG